MKTKHQKEQLIQAVRIKGILHCHQVRIKDLIEVVLAQLRAPVVADPTLDLQADLNLAQYRVHTLLLLVPVDHVNAAEVAVHQAVEVVLVRPKKAVGLGRDPDPVLAHPVLEANEAEVVPHQTVEAVLARLKKAVDPVHLVLHHEDLLLHPAPTVALVP